jgi:hypothetical protein
MRTRCYISVPKQQNLMALRDFSRQLEIGGIILALMEFLGVGKFVDQFFQWQIQQLRLFVRWYRGETQLWGLDSQISNITYFFILFSLISYFYSYVVLTVREIPITFGLVAIWIASSIVLYLIFLKVLLPVLETLIGLYIIIISFLNTKGVLAIAGILIALTGFIISQIGNSQVQP